LAQAHKATFIRRLLCFSLVFLTMAMCNAAGIHQQRQDALTLFFKGSFKEAEPLLRAALTHKLEQKEKDVTTHMLSQRVAESLVAQGRFREAEPFATNAVSGFGKWGPDDEDVLDCKCLMAEILKGLHKNPEAEKLAKSTIEDLKTNKKRGPDHVTTLRCQALFALALRDQGKFDDANAFAETTRKNLEAAAEKAETVASIGSRRLTAYECQNMDKVSFLLSNVLGETKEKDKRAFSKMTVSTNAPDSDEEWRAFDKMPVSPQKREH